MNHNLDIGSEFTENVLNAFVIPDVHGMVAIPGDGLLKPSAVPFRGGILAEKDTAHVVVNADNCESLVREEADSL